MCTNDSAKGPHKLAEGQPCCPSPIIPLRLSLHPPPRYVCAQTHTYLSLSVNCHFPALFCQQCVPPTNPSSRPPSSSLPVPDQLCFMCFMPLLQGYACVCNPCIPKPPSAAASAFGGLRVSGFAVLITVLPSLLVVGVLLGGFYIVRRHRLGSSIPNSITYSELQISSQSEVLGEGAHGLILKGTFCGVAVSCKRLLPPSNPTYPSPFDFEVNSKKSLDFGANPVYQLRTNSQYLLPSASPSKRQRRRSSFLELVSDNLQVCPPIACCLTPSNGSFHFSARCGVWIQVTVVGCCF